MVLEWFDARAGRPHTDDDVNDLRARYDAIPDVDPGDRQPAPIPPNAAQLFHTHPHLASEGQPGHVHAGGDQPHRH